MAVDLVELTAIHAIAVGKRSPIVVPGMPDLRRDHARIDILKKSGALISELAQMRAYAIECESKLIAQRERIEALEAQLERRNDGR